MPMPRHLLSKSTFLSGLQCEKRLYLQKHRRDLLPDISTSQQFIFSQGTQVGELAQQLFPGGKDATPESYFDFRPSIAQTKKWIDDGVEVIYEAAFQFDQVLVAVDLLVKDGGGWKAYEVKSSTEVKDVHRDDAAIQYHVITQSGIALKDISIVHINNTYARNGEISIHELFHIESVLQDVLASQAWIPQKIDDLKTVVQNRIEPQVPIGPHCSDPYECDLKAYCWSHVPEYSVFNIKNLRSKIKWKLYDQGIMQLEAIPDAFPLGANQRMQVESEKSAEIIIQKEAIENFLHQLNYPLYFLDFETFSTAVPIMNGTRPYQQIVFQYSLHIQEAPGAELVHSEHLADASQSNFLPDLIQQMIQDCGASGDIIVYNQGFESGKIRDLIEMYPSVQLQLEGMLSRIVDLMVPFQKRWYYTPEMKGSYSIKYVLPALVPELSYKDLEVQEGGAASSLFSMMVAGLFEGNTEKTREDLLEYCKLDTLAMVRILEQLHKL